jgi:thiol-disulfide isomerase/thioredoxin
MLLVKLSHDEIAARIGKAPPPRETPYFTTGAEFKPFKTTDIENQKINLKETRGKVVVLNFWFIDCAPCRKEMPDLNDMVEAFKGNDSVLFISIALDPKAKLEEFLKAFTFRYKVIDNGRFLAEKYGIKSYPTHVIIDQEGKVAFHTMGLGPQTVYWIRKTITGLLEKELAVKN